MLELELSGKAGALALHYLDCAPLYGTSNDIEVFRLIKALRFLAGKYKVSPTDSAKLRA